MTVCSVIHRSRAISLLPTPSRARRRICSSRRVSVGSADPERRWSRPRTGLARALGPAEHRAARGLADHGAQIARVDRLRDAARGAGVEQQADQRWSSSASSTITRTSSPIRTRRSTVSTSSAGSPESPSSTTTSMCGDHLPARVGLDHLDAVEPLQRRPHDLAEHGVVEAQEHPRRPPAMTDPTETASGLAVVVDHVASEWGEPTGHRFGSPPIYRNIGRRHCDSRRPLSGTERFAPPSQPVSPGPAATVSPTARFVQHHGTTAPRRGQLAVRVALRAGRPARTTGQIGAQLGQLEHRPPVAGRSGHPDQRQRGRQLRPAHAAGQVQVDLAPDDGEFLRREPRRRRSSSPASAVGVFARKATCSAVGSASGYGFAATTSSTPSPSAGSRARRSRSPASMRSLQFDGEPVARRGRSA